MKHTEAEMLTKAIQVLKDLQKQSFKEDNVRMVGFTEKDNVARPRGAIMPAWTIAIDISFLDTTNFLIISDDTGEPLYLQSKHLVMEIEKNEEGVYATKR